MDELELAERAAGNAKRAAVITVIACAVAVAVLLIDQGIKRAVLDAVMTARNTLDDFNTRVEAMTGGGTEEAGTGGDADHAGVGPGDGVGGDAAGGAVLAEAADAGGGAQDHVAAGVAGRAPGDGR